jgi:hypothetical protein
MSLKVKELLHNRVSNRFALLPVTWKLTITRVTSRSLPLLTESYGDVEAPQSTRGRTPAQRRPPLFVVASFGE